MSKLISNSFDILSLIHNSKKPEVVADIVRLADNFIILSFCEISFNILYSKIPLTNQQKAQLRKHKANIRLLASKSKNSRIILRKDPKLCKLLLRVALPVIELLKDERKIKRQSKKLLPGTGKPDAEEGRSPQFP